MFSQEKTSLHIATLILISFLVTHNYLLIPVVFFFLGIRLIPLTNLTGRLLTLGGAVFFVVILGYNLGKDLAIRDNHITPNKPAQTPLLNNPFPE